MLTPLATSRVSKRLRSRDKQARSTQAHVEAVLTPPEHGRDRRRNATDAEGKRALMSAQRAVVWRS
jgi:hypothetical protein